MLTDHLNDGDEGETRRNWAFWTIKGPGVAKRSKEVTKGELDWLQMKKTKQNKNLTSQGWGLVQIIETLEDFLNYHILKQYQCVALNVLESKYSTDHYVLEWL